MSGAGEVLRLPEGVIPEGCPSWDGVGAGRWVRALPAGWVPSRVTFLGGGAVLPLAAVAGAAAVGQFGLLPVWAAVLVCLQVVWAGFRPEAVVVSVPVGAVAVAVAGDLPWGVRVAGVAVLVVVWGAALLRVIARRPQRAAALAATGGYGSPFNDIHQLPVGAEIRVTTGQGTAVYTVTGVRRKGDPLPAALQQGQGRLTLITADGGPYTPVGTVRVDATLTSTVQPAPARPLSLGWLDESEKALGTEDAAWLPVFLWSQALLPTALLRRSTNSPARSPS